MTLNKINDSLANFQDFFFLEDFSAWKILVQKKSKDWIEYLQKGFPLCSTPGQGSHPSFSTEAWRVSQTFAQCHTTDHWRSRGRWCPPDIAYPLWPTLGWSGSPWPCRSGKVEVGPGPSTRGSPPEGWCWHCRRSRVGRLGWGLRGSGRSGPHFASRSARRCQESYYVDLL